MIKKIKYIAHRTLFLLFILLFTSNANAGVNVTSTIRMVGVLGNGDLFLDFPNPIIEAGCDSNQIRLPNDSPIKKDVLAIALAAYAAGFELQVMTTGCYGSHPTIGASGYIHPKRK